MDFSAKSFEQKTTKSSGAEDFDSKTFFGGSGGYCNWRELPKSFSYKIQSSLLITICVQNLSFTSFCFFSDLKSEFFKHRHLIKK
jgi:hypothetical protein